MAKSLRSKWKRKMRAVKRERYGEKELKRLNEMLIKAGDYQLVPEVKKEAEDDEVASMAVDGECTIVEGPIKSTSKPESESGRPRRIKFRKERGVNRKSRKDGMEATENDDEMAVDKIDRVFSKRTMRDQFGNYPAWMNKRKMITQQKKNKRINKRRAASVAGKKK